MSRKLYFSVFFILLICLLGTSKAAVDYQGKRAYWSDLDPANHDWSNPNNWWTLEEYYDTVEEEYSCVKAESNEVPDVNTRVFFGKGEAHQNYPVYLKEYIQDDNVIIEPVIDSGTFDINDILCGGGEENLDGSIGDPNLNHYLTITGGTLNVGTPILGEDWYRAWDPYGFGGQYDEEFFGRFRSSALRIGIVRGGTGTMNMTGGTVNLGGHIEIGAWGGEGELNMDGGTINITQGFYCTSALYGATGRAYLRGGTINAGYLDMITQDYYSGDESSSGLIDFSGGKMVLEGDESGEVLNFAAGNVAGATITAYGTALGKIVKDSSSPMNGKRAFLSVAYSIDCNTTVQAAAADPEQAWDPRPAEDSAYVMGPPETVARPELIWSPGDDVDTHDVYLGTDFNEVNDADISDMNVFMATLPKAEVTYNPTANLQALANYYWRIDEVDKNNNITKGQVWTFKTADFAKATYPVPPHKATGVFPDELTWTPGIHAETHDVYFSSNFNDVNDRIGGGVNISTNVYPVPGLQLDTIYYWRVDELSGLDMWPGDLWIFTITDHMNIDDMEAYESGVNEIRDTWKDYWDPDNDTAAEVFIDIAVVHDGNQSMRFNYVNEYSGGNYYSEARADIADLEIGPDWTKGGAKTVVINFYGDKDNIVDANNHMYFAIEDAYENTAAIPYPGDMTDFQDPEWHEWNIALEDFNDINNVKVTNVARVYIGFGDRDIPFPPGSCLGGEGSNVYFDELEIRPRRCAAAASHPYGDINGDCMVDYNDMAEMSADWLVVDYNTIGFHGELIGFTEDVNDPNYDMCWVDGRKGYPDDHALEFGYGHLREDEDKDTPTSDDFVKVPPLNWYSDEMTITVWVKRHGHQRDDAAIFYCDGSHEVRWEEGDTVAGLNIGIPVGKQGDESLGYMWPDVTGKIWQWNPDISILPDYEWAFCALVVKSNEGRIYIQLPGKDLELDWTTAYTHLVAKFAIPSTIGMHKERFFDGVIDDLRIFKDPLPIEQIRWLASDGAEGDEPNTPYIWYKFDEVTGLTTEDSGMSELMYHPNPSKANIYQTQDEPIYRRYVNFTDYSVLADNWLKDLEFPIQ